MTTETTNLKEVMLVLAEKLSYLCPGYDGGHPVEHGCLECGGLGVHYPLRQNCLGLRSLASPHFVVQVIGIGHEQNILGGGCSCEGRGWMPIEPHLETLLLAASRCGVEVSIELSAKRYSQEKHTTINASYSVYTFCLHSQKEHNSPDVDITSGAMLEATCKAILSVLGEEIANAR